MPASALKVQPVSRLEQPLPNPLPSKGNGSARRLPATRSPQTRSKVRKLCDTPISTQPPVLHADAHELAMQYRSAARKLALSMVTKWKCRLEKDELQSVIDLALCEAASRYNCAHGAAFMTFLYYHLKGKLIKTIAARADTGLVFIDDYERSRLSVYGDDESSDVRTSEWRSYGNVMDIAYEPEDALYRQQLVELCLKACQRLKGIEREVIWRVYFENKELNEVTTEMGYSRGHLFRVRMRALQNIRKAVAQHCK